MLYRRLIFKGENGEAAEFHIAVGQCGKGAPTADTEGCVGVSYMDTDTGDMYKCISDEGGACKWELMPCSADIEGLKTQIANITPVDASDVVHNGVRLSEIWPVKVTLEEYQALEAAGKKNPNTFYIILPEG